MLPFDWLTEVQKFNIFILTAYVGAPKSQKKLKWSRLQSWQSFYQKERDTILMVPHDLSKIKFKAIKYPSFILIEILIELFPIEEFRSEVQTTIFKVFFYSDYLQGALSLNEKLGDVDFYPNGGKHQPGCDEICPILIGCIHSNLWDLFFGSCSHHRSCDYYLESLHEYGQGRAIFVSKNCNNWSDFLANDCKEDTNDLQMGEGLQFVK